jgi:alkylation response protein AidB-like acyl-CoA dehydrogenase
MDFDFTDEQNQLRDALRRYLERSYTFARRRDILASADGFSREVWRQLAELGVLALEIPERFGGSGGGPVDTLVAMEELGRAIVVEPYVSTVVLGAGLVAHAGDEGLCRAILPDVAAGKRLVAFAHGEADARYRLDHVTTHARGLVLDGVKTVVLGGAAADTLIASARLDGEIALFVVDANAPGVTRTGYTTHDGHRAADIVFANVRAEGVLGRGLPLVEAAVGRAIAAVCGEALGIMATLVDVTTAYVKTRKQFGVPIGTFQVLQHRLAEMVMRVEQARSMTYLVTTAGGDPKIVAAAKALVGQASRFVGQQAVQLHGAIGITDEAAVSHYFKRLATIDLLFGDADTHVARFAELS